MKYTITFLFLIGSLTNLLSQSLDIPLVTVQGSSTIFAQPDEILLTFTIFNKSDVLVDVRAQNEKATKAAISFLKSKNIPNKHIQTQRMHVGPKLRHRINEVEYFQASHSIHICLSEVSQYDDIVDGLIGLGIYQIGNPVFKTTKMIEIRKQAKKQAMQDAKAKATLLANELGQTIGKAKLIEDFVTHQNRNSGAYSSGSDFGGSGSADDLSFAPGQVQINASIKVSFQLN